MSIKENIKKEKETIKKVGFVLLYTFLVIGVCLSAGLVFHKYYYTVFHIVGQSMYPTLNREGTAVINPNRKDFGIVDTNPATINNAKRFDIVTTYYTTDYNIDGELKEGAEKKIKRIIGLPGDKVETFPREIKINNALLQLPFTPSEGNIPSPRTIELQDNEYFVMGDNWGNSSDSTSVGPVNKSMINGVLIAIEGTCVLDTDPNTGKLIASDFKYHWPTYYKK